MGTAQWESTCLEGTKPWLPFPTSQKIKEQGEMGLGQGGGAGVRGCRVGKKRRKRGVWRRSRRGGDGKEEQNLIERIFNRERR